MMGLYEKLTENWYAAPQPIEVVETDDRWEVVDVDGMAINVHKRPEVCLA